ncbi:futalosine hydrolase [Streptomyces formicae]|uniref:Futalosine hydrolase n=1 Tax=Streptomyces formicae TaxID=1616117 RepID=A0ABY3WX29_9ACTN|nr:futalosine hydrolase [Streptomyces formicae]UNM15862.1 futalosine hydrolase [Streptomyces formicae]
MRVLVVTAVPAEADSVSAGLAVALPGAAATTVALPGGRTLRRRTGAGATVDVLSAGVGPAAAAAGTAAALTAAAYETAGAGAGAHETAGAGAGAYETAGAGAGGAVYDLVVSAGIGGGFPHAAPLGALVVADAIVAADLGAGTSDGFLTVDELGFGRSAHTPSPLSARIAKAVGAAHGPVLTVSTVTGTAARTDELMRRHPRAAAEAMEGFGVAEAAAAHSVPVAEIRAVSNAVGPRDRAAWRIGDALEALRRAFEQLGPVFEGPVPKEGAR